MTTKRISTQNTITLLLLLLLKINNHKLRIGQVSHEKTEFVNNVNPKK